MVVSKAPKTLKNGIFIEESTIRVQIFGLSSALETQSKHNHLQIASKNLEVYDAMHKIQPYTPSLCLETTKPLKNGIYIEAHKITRF